MKRYKIDDLDHIDDINEFDMDPNYSKYLMQLRNANITHDIITSRSKVNRMIDDGYSIDQAE